MLWSPGLGIQWCLRFLLHQASWSQGLPCQAFLVAEMLEDPRQMILSLVSFLSVPVKVRCFHCFLEPMSLLGSSLMANWTLLVGLSYLHSQIPSMWHHVPQQRRRDCDCQNDRHVQFVDFNFLVSDCDNHGLSSLSSVHCDDVLPVVGHKSTLLNCQTGWQCVD